MQSGEKLRNVLSKSEAIANCVTSIMLQAIKYSRGELLVLNQLKLPYESVYEKVPSAAEGWQQIRSMKVRGAPAIAIVAALSLAVELEELSQTNKLSTISELVALVDNRWEHLKTSRPTAVNLFDAATKLLKLVKETAKTTESPQALAQVYINAAEKMLEDDLADNINMGKHGGEYIWELSGRNPDGLVMLTHCNTGSLATAGFGTALGVIRHLHQQQQLKHVYCTETRPYNQGSRLTAYELVTEKMPATLITDSMVSALMHTKGVSAVVVGADRVAANGDTANKIGTYQLAIVANYHKVPFFVVAPSTSIDLNISSGSEIPIEERKQAEVLQVTGADTDNAGQVVLPVTMRTVQVGTSGINVWNPAFDVTPASLITGIVTERGVILKEQGQQTFAIRQFLQL